MRRLLQTTGPRWRSADFLIFRRRLRCKLMLLAKWINCGFAGEWRLGLSPDDGSVELLVHSSRGCLGSLQGLGPSGLGICPQRVPFATAHRPFLGGSFFFVCSSRHCSCRCGMANVLFKIHTLESAIFP